jgi:hypothetical protein
MCIARAQEGRKMLPSAGQVTAHPERDMCAVSATVVLSRLIAVRSGSIS